MKRIFTSLFPALLLSIVLIGPSACVRNPVAGTVPGSTSVPGTSTTDGGFDADAFLTLVTIDGAIKATKDQLVANRFPVADIPKIKTALNDVITYYNLADTAYREYHGLAIAGPVTLAQQSPVTAAIAAAEAKVSILTAAKTGNL